MDKETTEYRAKVMLAWANGAEIQQKVGEAWMDSIDPGWDWNYCDYRVKPATKSPDMLYVCVSSSNRTTNYAVMPNRQAAETYPCDEILVVNVIERIKGIGASNDSQ